MQTNPKSNFLGADGAMRHLSNAIACAVLFAAAVSSGLAVEVVVPARNHAAKRGEVNPADKGWDGLLVVQVDEDESATRARLRELLPGVDEILFVRRLTMQSSHYYTDFIDGCVDYGGNLCALSLKDGTVRDLAPSLAHGLFGRCCLSFDGKRVAFDWKEKLGVGFRIWEVGIDGQGLRQLTFPPDDEDARIKKYNLNYSVYRHHTDDLHPCYLPDGGLCFTSSRCEYGILCDPPDKLTTTLLHRMDADGKNIELLSNNSVSESAPSIMNDGRILYTRWEYVDNGSVTNKALWAMRPDGTGSEEVYGKNIAFPSVFYVGRAVPGCNDRFVAIGAPHMPLGVGTLMLIDTRFDRRTGMPVTYLTPEVDTQHQWGWDNVPGGATKPLPPEQQGGRDGSWQHRPRTALHGPLSALARAASRRLQPDRKMERQERLGALSDRRRWPAALAAQGGRDLLLESDPHPRDRHAADRARRH